MVPTTITSFGEGKGRVVNTGDGETDKTDDQSGTKDDDINSLERPNEGEGGKIIVHERVDPTWKKYLEAEHRLFLNEIKQIHCEGSKSLDLATHLIGRSGCAACDSRHRIAVTVPIYSNLKLKQHIQFIPSTSLLPAHFEYSRMWTGLFDHLPSGEEECRTRCEKLFNKLNRGGTACARESTFRMQKLFVNKKLAWASPFDLAQRHTFIPNLAVLKTGSSSSIRLCLAPTTMYNSPFGPISYNQCLAPLPLSQPKFLRFQLIHLLTPQLFTGDLVQMFTSIRLSYESSLHTLTYAYQTWDLWPTLCLSDSHDKKLHPIRHLACGFGTREMPKVSKFCLAQTSTVFRRANKLNSEQSLLCNVVHDILDSDTFADDLLGGITLVRLAEWCTLTNNFLPDPPPCAKQCSLAGRCTQEGICWSRERLHNYRTRVKELSEQFLLKLAAMLIQVLNFSSFELKYLKGSPSIQQTLNNLVAKQYENVQEKKLQVKRPTQTELDAHIKQLSPQYVHEPQTSSPEEILEGTIEHLGHCYLTTNQIQLKSTSLSIIYTCEGRQRRSVNFFTFDQFHQFYKTTQPIFTKRSLFSILAKNCCVSGNFLVIFKSQLKVVIRLFIRKNRKASWNVELDTETVRKLIMCIETYFYLVHKSVMQTPTFKYQTNELYIIGLSDGSENLETYTISLVGRACVGGVVTSEVVHLSLQSYTVHCDLLNIVDIEYLAFQRLIGAMSVIVHEMQSLGVHIANNNRLAFSDSKVMLTLLRSRVDLLKKRQAHLTAKVQLQLHDLNMSPFTSVGHISQSVANHLPDHFSKYSFTHNNQAEISSKYNSIMDHKWLKSAHPRKLPGLSFDNAYPSSSETHLLKSAVLDSEWKEYSTSYNNVENTVLLSAANKVLKASHCKQDVGCHQSCGGSQAPGSLFCHPSGLAVGKQCDVAENDLDQVFEKNVIQDSSLASTRVRCEKIVTSNKMIKGKCDRIMSGMSEKIVTSSKKMNGAPKLEKSLRCDTNTVELSEKSKMEKQYEVKNDLRCDKSTVGLSENPNFSEARCAATRTQSASNTQKRLGICIADDRDSWRRQIDWLLNRKRSYGLSGGSALRILATCLRWGKIARQQSQLGSEGRTGRQQVRLQLRQEKIAREFPDSESTLDLVDPHDWPRPATDLMKSRFGDFQDYLKESKLPRREGQEEEERQVFHHLCSLYNCSTPVKGFNNVTYHNLDGSKINILEARRQRSYPERKLRIPRMRKIKPDSPWAETLIRAAHHYGKGRNMNKTVLGLLNLSVYIAHQSELLLRLQQECPSCRRRRARQQIKTDAVRLERLGPSDFMNRAIQWQGGESTTLCDVVGPFRMWSNFQDSEEVKIFAVIFIQLPLKTATLVPLQSYSAAHLLQAIKTYINLKMRPCQLWLSDAGSNLQRFTNLNPGFESCEEEPKVKLKAWQDLATGERGKDLRQYGVHVRICAKDHKVMASIEQAVFTTKRVLYSFNRSLQTPLTIWEWLYVFSEVSACIASRPLCATSQGRLYSAHSILSCLEQSGLHLGDDQLYIHQKGTEEVTAQLEAMGDRLQELRESLTEILLVLMVLPAFLDVQVRRENIKTRDSEDDVHLNCVFFDPHLFKKNNNVTGSLLRLHQWGKSRQIGLFQKAGKLKHHSYVTRPLDQLYLVAKNDLDQVFGQKEWVPSWNLRKAAEAMESQPAYFTWNPSHHPEQPMQEEKEEQEEEKEEQEKEKSGEATVRKTRRGRIIRRPKIYQA